MWLPLIYFADGLGDNEDSVWMGFPRSWAGFIGAIQFSLLKLIQILLRICDNIFLKFYIFLHILGERKKKKREQIAGQCKRTGADVDHNFLERSTEPGTSWICQKKNLLFLHEIHCISAINVNVMPCACITAWYEILTRGKICLLSLYDIRQREEGWDPNLMGEMLLWQFTPAKNILTTA